LPIRRALFVQSGNLDTEIGIGQDRRNTLTNGGMMSKVIHCPCGTDVEAESDDDLVTRVEEHIAEDHPDKVGSMSREQILESAEVR
jgi:hypothetical protein